GYAENIQADGQRKQYTQKERDAETGLDFFGARYYSSVAGRFTSVDQGAHDATDPQSWNLYRYARNNPLYYVDPDGHSDTPASPKFEKAMATLDPTLYDAIKASTNISQSSIEKHIHDEGLASLKGGIAKQLIGVAGEAFAAESYAFNPGQGNLSSFSPILQPVTRGLNALSKALGRNVSLSKKIGPDLAVPFTSL